jgi:Ca-activated chloride channel family protein
MLKKIILLLFILFSLQIIFSDSVRISQIDTSKLLFNQDVGVYVSITNDRGDPIKNISKDMVTIYESTDGKNFEKIENIKDFDNNANFEKGINFLLLIDNSGSMYQDMNGRNTSNESIMRIKYAKDAVRNFLDKVNIDKDKVGLAVYNSYYTAYSKPISDKEVILGQLDNITKPQGDEGWSEIYSSLYLAIDDFSTVKGRKALIILSDGENMPYYTNTKKEHKDFGTKIVNYEEPIIEGMKEGISIFAINFGRPGERKDAHLREIARETGGAVFNAYDPRELNSVYSKINNQILNEYLITYRATMLPSDKKYVKVDLNKNNRNYKATRYYFSSALFGQPLDEFNPLIFLLFLLAAVLLWLLSLIKFEKINAPPSLEVLSTQVGRPVTKLLTLNKGGKTIIGSSENSDMTIVGAPTMKKNHATIQFDKTKSAYTIVADGDLTVNNRSTKSKILESGDVISAGGSTIVFDEGMMTRLKTKKKKKK